MANQEHLALIKQGVTVWNDWYKRNKRVIPDLAKANLSGLDLSGINLQRADLDRANLSQTNLSKARLVNANLLGTNLLAADLQNANLKGANLDYAIFCEAKINAKTTIASKSRKIWEIVNNKAKDKNFQGIDLSNSNLFRADFSQADLSHAKLENANLNSANFNNAYLYRANLKKANLQNADLRNAYFSQANLTHASLNGASCCGTYFKDAELSFANLKQAKLSHKTMIDLKWHSVWEIVNCGAVRKNLSGVDLSNANLQGVNFAEANLTNANLSHTILRYSNLDRANLTNSDLAGANISGVDLDRANLKGANLKSVIGRDSGNIEGRDVQLPPAMKPVHTHSNVMVKERPTTLQAVTTPIVADLRDNQSKKPKNNKNAFGFLFFAVITLIVSAWYTFSEQNSIEQQPTQKLQSWKDKIEQLIPNS